MKGRIANRVSPVRGQAEFHRFGCTTLPANVEFDLLWLRPLATVISLTSKRSIRLRSRGLVVWALHSRGKSCPSCIICCFCWR